MATSGATSAWHNDRSHAPHALPLTLPFTSAPSTTQTRPTKLPTSHNFLVLAAGMPSLACLRSTRNPCVVSTHNMRAAMRLACRACPGHTLRAIQALRACARDLGAIGVLTLPSSSLSRPRRKLQFFNGSSATNGFLIQHWRTAAASAESQSGTCPVQP